MCQWLIFRLQAKAAQELSTPLAILFQKSLDTGIVPNDWKIADMASVFKRTIVNSHLISDQLV